MKIKIRLFNFDEIKENKFSKERSSEGNSTEGGREAMESRNENESKKDFGKDFND